MKKILTLLIMAISLNGCAQNARHIEASYISTARYDGWQCSKLTKEYRFVQQALIRVSKTQDDAAAADVLTVILVGRPVSSGGIKGQVSSLKGQRLALRQAIHDGGCGNYAASRKIIVNP